MKGLILILIIAVYLWYVFIITYHLIRFGIGVKPKILAWLFFFVSIFLLILLIIAFLRINWEEISKFISSLLAAMRL